MAYGSTTFKQRSMAKRRPIRRRRARTVSRKRASSSAGSRLANKKRRIKPVSDLQKHVQVINHPYSLPGHPAKIPDGAVSHSLNRRMRYTGTVKNKQGEDTLHILLYAGFGIGAVAFNADGVSPAASNTLPMGFTDQGMEMSFWALGAGLGTGHQNIVNQSQVSSWRPVSHAGRLTLDAVSEENNGYAEVVRITNPNNIVDHWGMAPLTNGSVDETKAAVVPQETAVTGMLPYLMGLALNQQPGYEQIPLKNLKDREFKLNPLSSEIKFNQVEQRYNLEVGADTTYNAATDTLSFARDNGTVHSLFDGILDNNHDMIYLRIHCRDNNGTTQFGSQLMVDIVQNSEFQLHPTSPFATFQHAAPKAAKNVTKIIDDANDNIRSSKSRVEPPITQALNMDIDDDWVQLAHPKDDVDIVMTDTIDKDIKEQFEIQTDHNLASLHDADWWADYFDHDQEFGNFMEDAYASEGKYSIRVNPYTGKKEMMVAGTDSYGNWLQNVAEGTPSAWKGVSLKKREEASEYYDEIARKNNVDVIYGHSRGAAHLTDMQYEATYVGIDGATSIGHKRPDMVNVIGDQFFDKVIGRGHKDTVRLEGRGFHNVTKSKARVKRENTDKKQLVARAKKQAKFQDKSKFTAKKTRTRSEIRKTDPRKKKKVKNERRRTRRVYNKRRF